jgi:hypothetical protein
MKVLDLNKIYKVIKKSNSTFLTHVLFVKKKFH